MCYCSVKWKIAVNPSALKVGVERKKVQMPYKSCLTIIARVNFSAGLVHTRFMHLIGFLRARRVYMYLLTGLPGLIPQSQQ